MSLSVASDLPTLVDSARWLDLTAELVKSDGLMLLVLYGEEAQGDRWRDAPNKKG